jgi:hypothetical protein
VTLLCYFYQANTRDIENCRALQALAKRFEKTSSKFEERANDNQNSGRGKGGGGFKASRGRGNNRQISCYNYDEKGHISNIVPCLEDQRVDTTKPHGML